MQVNDLGDNGKTGQLGGHRRGGGGGEGREREKEKRRKHVDGREDYNYRAL